MGRKILGGRPLWCKFVTDDGVYYGGGNLMQRAMQSLSMGERYTIKNDFYFNRLKLLLDFFDNKRNLRRMVPWEEGDDEPNLLLKRKDEECNNSMTPVSKTAGKKKGKKKRALRVAKRKLGTHKRAKKSEEMRAAGGGEKK